MCTALESTINLCKKMKRCSHEDIETASLCMDMVCCVCLMLTVELQAVDCMHGYEQATLPQDQNKPLHNLLLTPPPAHTLLYMLCPVLSISPSIPSSRIPPPASPPLPQDEGKLSNPCWIWSPNSKAVGLIPGSHAHYSTWAAAMELPAWTHLCQPPQALHGPASARRPHRSSSLRPKPSEQPGLHAPQLPRCSAWMPKHLIFSTLYLSLLHASAYSTANP